MSAIEQVHAREVTDGFGSPSVEVVVRLNSGVEGRAAVAHGGRLFSRSGLALALANVNGEVSRELHGQDAADQRRVDDLLISLDGTEDKRRLGADVMLGVSVANARAAAAEDREPLWRHLGAHRASRNEARFAVDWVLETERPAEAGRTERADILPVPIMSVLAGGPHAKGLDFREFMVAPVGADSFAAALRMSAEVYQGLRRTLRQRGLPAKVGEEGGFIPELHANEAPLELLLAAIEVAGYAPGEDVAICLAPAASEFFKDGLYELSGDQRSLSSSEMVSYWDSVCSRYPVLSLEDGMARQDWDGWRMLTERIGRRVQLVGNELFATNLSTLREGISRGIANSVLVKPNRVGTLSETLDIITTAREEGYRCVISHRAGEAEDEFVAELAVATGVGQIKTGAPTHPDPIEKYTSLLRIEQQLGDRALYAGRTAVALL